jgi:hypothetical protein
MTVAHDKADETYLELVGIFSRVNRHLKDERLKELVNGLRKAPL